MKDTVVMVMAGGKGSRLEPLTCHRSKPAVPFAGQYRIIDFVLSNLVNSGYRKIYVLTQYMASSMIKHLNRNWRLGSFGEFIEIVPAQMRLGEFWYRGTADSVFQNINLIRDTSAQYVAVFGGDHIYKMAIDQMDARHRQTQADLTVAAFPVPRSEAHQFGCIDVDEYGRIVRFVEKPKNPPPIPGRPDWSFVSMGNYIFRTDVLLDALQADSTDPTSSHDFGRDIIPRLVNQLGKVFAYDFSSNQVPGDPPGTLPYWRDVGTIDSYFEANMEVRAHIPSVDLYNRKWRIHAAQRGYPPARFVQHEKNGQPVKISNSLVCEGSIVSSATLDNVVLGYDCFVHAGSHTSESVILSGCDIGANARLHRVILDKNCKIEPGTTIGENPEQDKKRFPFISYSGIVVLPKGTHVPKQGPIHFAADVEAIFRTDPDLQAFLQKANYAVSTHSRHSYLSVGPRYNMYGPPALEAPQPARDNKALERPKAP